MFHIQSGNGKSTRRISSHDSSHGSPCAILMKMKLYFRWVLWYTVTKEVRHTFDVTERRNCP